MAVTVTYSYPVAGVTAPTATQAKELVIANVIAAADGDTAATITHNFGLTTNQIAVGFPLVSLIGTKSQALTALSAWAVTSITTNTIVLTKLASTGSGDAAAQLTVQIQRPHSILGSAL